MKKPRANKFGAFLFLLLTAKAQALALALGSCYLLKHKILAAARWHK